MDHAEGPVWDARKNVLYFVDIHSGRVLSYNYYTEEIHALDLGGDVSIVAPSKSDPDLLIVANNRSVVAVRWNGVDEPESPVVLTTVAEDHPTSRFNDGKPDKEGRLWFGTYFVELLRNMLNK